MGLQKGFFRLPPQKDIPVICVGPGTGVAPMRSLIEERIYQGSYCIFLPLILLVDALKNPQQIFCTLGVVHRKKTNTTAPSGRPMRVLRR